MTAQPVGVMPLSGALPTTHPDPDPDPAVVVILGPSQLSS